MISITLHELLKCLSEDTFKTAVEISRQLHIGERTVRTRLKELNDELKEYGAYIESKPRFGSRLVIQDIEKYEKLETENTKEDQLYLDTVKERENFLAVYLLSQGKYIKMDDLCDFLHISKSTLTAAIKQVENVYKKYGIQIQRRPNYGIIAEGTEMNFRRCIGDIVVKRNGLSFIRNDKQRAEISRMSEIALEYLQKYKISFSESAFENFISHVYVGAKRITQGKMVSLRKKNIHNLGEHEWSFVLELTDKLAQEFQITYTEEEQRYIAIHLSGKRMMGSGEKDEMNFVVQGNLDQLVLKMLEAIYQEFRIDLRSDFDLRMALNQHMVPFDIRMRFGISLENPLLEDIKENYMMGFRMASVSSITLAEYYQKTIPENEIGFFALIYTLAMEKRKKNIEKKNILLVCGSGKGSSRLLKFRYQEEFGEYLDHLYVCDLIGLQEFDFSEIDYVFTTVPIDIHIPVPILEVGLFLEERDQRRVKKLLSVGQMDFLARYYCRETFLTGIESGCMEQVLKDLCEKVMQEKNVPEDFYDLVLQREMLGPTDYGNLVAIPHPLKTVTKESFVYVCVLDKPIFWRHYDVQVIFLTVIGNGEDPDLQKFYEITTQFIVNNESIQKLIHRPEYDYFIDLLQEQDLPD